MSKLVIILLCFSLFSCKNNILFKADKELKNTNWHTDSLAVFEFDVSDTISTYLAEINIRHTIDYSFQNLFIFIHTKMPNGQFTNDTIECILADKNGKWKGKGIGDILDFTKIYKQDIIFKTKGNYKIEIEQAMRYGKLSNINLLEEIVSVGVCVREKEN
ncbi:MAG: gliding motility lipoprotein GldH [Flavobacteriales bacterium]|nr:gliding motility lipoprotein GldH [Flavobacteriales bacterium]